MEVAGRCPDLSSSLLASLRAGVAAAVAAADVAAAPVGVGVLVAGGLGAGGEGVRAWKSRTEISRYFCVAFFKLR